VSVDRRALIIACPRSKGRDRPTKQKVKSLVKRWSKVAQRYHFHSLRNKRAKADVLISPDRAQLTSLFDERREITDDTEFLVYFLGHSTAHAENDLRLILGIDENGEDKSCILTWLLMTLYGTPVKKLILILDTCHAGRTAYTLNGLQFEYYAMLATGSAYAFDAQFTEGLLRAFEEPLRKSDQRIDRTVGGVTYKKVFEYARSYVIERNNNATSGQVPMSLGDFTGDILRVAPVVVPQAYNLYASRRTIYGRLFLLLQLLLRHQNVTLSQLRTIVGRHDAFLLRRNENSSDDYLSWQRLDDYISFMRTAGWLTQPGGRFQITERGRTASNRNRFNRALLDTIERQVFPEALTLVHLDQVVSELLRDMVPPTPAKIKERAAMKGVAIPLNAATRIALQMLPSTGRFLKVSADTIFPSERGGTQGRTQPFNSLV
jgi:hypothetical protein